MTGLPDDLASILQIWCIRCQYGHFVNQGIGGNRLLHDVTGDSGLKRFDRDALESAFVPKKKRRGARGNA